MSESWKTELCTSLVVRRLDNESSLRKVCWFSDHERLPSLSTFLRVRRDMETTESIMDSRIEEATNRIREFLPNLGEEIAVDATTIRSNSNGNRDPVSDPEAAWGIGNKAGAKSGKNYIYGYRPITAVDANYDLPVHSEVGPANMSEKSAFIPFMEKLLALGLKPKIVTADRGFDSEDNSEWLQERGIAPVIHKIAPKSKKHARDWYKWGFSPDGSPLCGCGIARPYLRTDPDTGERVYGPSPKGCQNLLKPNRPALGDTGICREEVRIDPTLDVRLFGGDIRRGSPEWNAAYKKRWSVERVYSRWKGPGRINDHHLRGLSGIRLLTQLHTLSLLSRKLAELEAEAKARDPTSIAA